MQKEFDSEYCKVTYMVDDNAVLLTWKKFSSYENYRKPTTFALNLLRDHKDSNFIIDARNGFEDEKEDVVWGFSYLLPEMSKTGCKYVVFIMNTVNEIEEEMDMWTLEFNKYFTVNKVASYSDAVTFLRIVS